MFQRDRALRPVALFLAIWVSGLAGGRVSRAEQPPAASNPILLELFTSEGCSSCPPADRLLMKLASEGKVAGVPVVALEWHVDYWNYIGWADPFSSQQHSARQRQYAGWLNSERVYTPQLVIDGRSETIGSSDARLRSAIAELNPAPRARLTLSRQGVELLVELLELPTAAAGQGALWLALTERGLTTAVSRGENSGQTLAHGPVVRSYRRIGKVTTAPAHLKATLQLDKRWRLENLSAVVFLQQAQSGQILGVAQLPLNP